MMMRLSDGEIIEFYESIDGTGAEIYPGEDFTCASCGRFAKLPGTISYLWIKALEQLTTALNPSIELCEICNERVSNA